MPAKAVGTCSALWAKTGRKNRAFVAGKSETDLKDRPPNVPQPRKRGAPRGRESCLSLYFTTLYNDRDGGIRTRDPLNPIQVRYRAALRPVLNTNRAETER